eukprot:351255-Prymnesium_polylepis.1
MALVKGGGAWLWVAVIVHEGNLASNVHALRYAALVDCFELVVRGASDAVYRRGEPCACAVRQQVRSLWKPYNVVTKVLRDEAYDHVVGASGGTRNLKKIK